MEPISNKNDLRIFASFENIEAGFTRKPDTADARRNLMVSSAEKSGGCVVKPILVHGNKVAAVTEGMLAGKSYIEITETDGLVTDIPNVVLTTTHADCIPLFAYDSHKKVIGIAHAGWKGTSKGIAYELALAMINNYGCDATNITAYIGPGICKKYFEFGKDYAEECFVAKSDWMKNFIISTAEDPDKVKIDLKGINESFFNLAGVTKVEISSDCTYLDERYYSYRRAKDTERMLAYIVLK